MNDEIMPKENNFETDLRCSRNFVEENDSDLYNFR